MRWNVGVALCAMLVAGCVGAAPDQRVDGGGAARSAVAPGPAGPSGMEGTMAAVPSPPGDPGDDTPAPLEPSEGFAVSRVAFSDGDRRIDMPVLVADTAELRARGLMHRTQLPDAAGMLFMHDAPTDGGFWMKNTLLPLSIAFVGQDGVVQQIIDMQPCTADPCRGYVPDAAYRWAVEANQGYFASRGIEAGWTLETASVGGAQ